MSKRRKDPNEKHRFLLVIATICVVFIYAIRLFYLQILSPNYKARADSNAFYQKPVYPSRGVIYDRNGELLVYNEPAYDLVAVTKEVGEFDTLALCQTLNVEPEYVHKRFQDIRDRRINPGYSPYVPQLLLAQLNPREAGRFQEQLFKFPGFSIRPRAIRQYKYHGAAHVLGYLSEANTRDLERDSSLIAGDYVGRSGVERQYEKTLRGEKGIEVLLRDARGRIKGHYSDGKYDSPAIPGRDLTLSIDSKLQTLGEQLMQGKRGAIVMIEPETGEVLCLVSSPSYDPSLLAGKDRGKNHLEMEHDRNKPLYARAIQATYPPGSTFKPAQGAIFLQEGVIRPTDAFSCYHGFPPLNNRPACHSHGSPLSLVPALATSCNAFFCWGLRAMLDSRRFYPSVQEAFEHWKNRIVGLGFGYRLGLDLPGERRGYIPNSKVYDKAYKGRWNSSTIISISIGQGEILATPLQIANLGAIIANRGRYRRPHVVKAIQGIPLDTAYTNWQNSGISAANMEYIVEGMARAVTGGTCHAANFAPGEIEVCGKTGTAENPHGKDHSAFLGFAPRNNPKVVVSVYVENGGFGAMYGVPIGRVMMEYYLREGNLSPEGEAVATKMSNTAIHYSNVF